MKSISLFCVGMLFALTANATYCTNGYTNYPICGPVTPKPVKVHPPHPWTPAASQVQNQTQTQVQTQGQTQTATGGASTSTSDSSATATGGSAAGGSNTMGNIAPSQSIGGDSVNSKAWSLFLPPLAFVPPMSAIAGCAPEITQSSVGVAFGAYSAANGKTDPQDCTLIQLRNAKVDACQYASAKQIEDLMLMKKLPDYRPSITQYTDLEPRDCAAVKASAVAPNTTVVNFLADTPVPMPVKTQAKKPIKKAVQEKRYRTDACSVQSTVCKPVK